MKRKILFLSLALLSTLVFSTCDNEHPEVDILLERDFTEVIQAINDANKSLADKMSLIEAIMTGTTDKDQSLLKLVQAALSSLSGTLEEKLAAIQEALEARNTSLETKLALIQAAVENGFADYKSQQAMLLKALQAMEGTAEQKIAAIEEAIKAQTTNLETKLGLIEAAFQNGFADSAQANTLMVDAINSTGKTLEEKLAAIESAVKSQTASLESKLALVETAVNEGFATASDKEELLRQAVAALQGTMEEKLAAIESALKSGNTTLGTKLDLISAALEQGITDQQTAISNMQTALDTTIQGIGTTLATEKAAIIDALSALSGQLTTEELAKAFKDIADAITAQTQSESGLLEAIQKAIADVGEALVPTPVLTYLGDPTQTITLAPQKTFVVKIKVTPEDATIVQDKLQLNITSKDFFREGDTIGAEPDHFVLESLEADPSVPGQYDVTISTHSSGLIWNESVISLIYNCGKDDQEKAKYVSTQAFYVRLMPNPGHALNTRYYPNAGFHMRDTFFVKGTKEVKDTMGVIYCPLGRATFITEDGAESRTYTADNLTRVRFVQPNRPDTAAVFRKIDMTKHFVSFRPDTVGSATWKAFKERHAIDHENQEVTGKLALTDKWGTTDSLDLRMKWYVAWTISYEIVDTTTTEIKLKPSDFVKRNNTYYFLKYPEFWPTIVNPWGLDYNTLQECGLSLINIPKGHGDGYIGLALNLGDGPDTAELVTASKPQKGLKYQALGLLRVRVKPSDVDPDFTPSQILYKYQINRKINQDDTD